MSGKVLIDTSVWIEFFRKKDSLVSGMLREFLKLNRACYAGPIAVELYQGAKTEQEILVLDERKYSVNTSPVNYRVNADLNFLSRG